MVKYLDSNTIPATQAPASPPCKGYPGREGTAVAPRVTAVARHHRPHDAAPGRCSCGLQLESPRFERIPNVVTSWRSFHAVTLLQTSAQHAL